MEIVVLAVGALLLGLVFHKLQGNQYREKWRNWNISAYKIGLRYDSRSLNFDGDILGDLTTITIVDGEIVNVVGIHAETTSLEEYERFTVEGLFDLSKYYSTVQYDTVYGFPTRLGDTNHWVIEVISFELLSH